MDMPPVSVPLVWKLGEEEQLYYWSPEWQNAEHEALDELRRGLGVQFDDATGAIQWLLSDGG